MTTKRSLIPKGGNDVVYTPQDLADKIVKHFAPSGTVLEPSAGAGAFVKAIKKVTGRKPFECEIAKGADFFDFHQKVDHAGIYITEIILIQGIEIARWIWSHQDDFLIGHIFNFL